jgi:hypothetical protein
MAFDGIVNDEAVRVGKEIIRRQGRRLRMERRRQRRLRERYIEPEPKEHPQPQPSLVERLQSREWTWF